MPAITNILLKKYIQTGGSKNLKTQRKIKKERKINDTHKLQHNILLLFVTFLPSSFVYLPLIANEAMSFGNVRACVLRVTDKMLAGSNMTFDVGTW